MENIRKLTRLVPPSDDDYLFRLGIALYGFASINSFMCEVIARIDPRYSHTTLQNKETGEILDIFRQTLKTLKAGERVPVIHQTMQDVADLFEHLNTQRNDIIHTYPITNGDGEQILHRRKDEKGKYFEVTNGFLDSFISRLHDVSTGLDVIRKQVWSQK